MKLSTHPRELSSIITSLSRIPIKHPSFVWLERIALVAEGAVVAVRAANLGLSAELSTFADVSDSGVILVDANQLLMALQGIPDSVNTVTLEHVAGELVVTAQGVLVHIPTYESSDMPTVTQPNGVEIARMIGSDMVHAIRHTVFAASNSDIKPELASQFFQTTDTELICVATDGFRLAEYRTAIQSGVVHSCMISAKYSAEIARIVDFSDPIVISASSEMVHITFPAGILAVRTTTGTYPDYQQIIPKEISSEAIILRDDMQRACRVASNFTDQFTKVDVTLRPDAGEVVVEAPRSERGSGVVTLSGTVTGQEITLRMSAKNILDALSVINDASVQFRTSGPGKPIICQGFHDKSTLLLMMPMSR